MKKNNKRVEAHKVERAVNILMLIFGVCAVLVFGVGLSRPSFGRDAIFIEMFLIIIVAILAQTTLIVRMLEKLM
ncbi:MAG: hypothetical protein ACQER9_02155 [Nanobdellota archaeon]